MNKRTRRAAFSLIELLGVSTNFFGISSSLMGARANLSFQGESVDLVHSAIFQRFRPDGTMAMNHPIRLRLVRGSWNSLAEHSFLSGKHHRQWT